MMLCSDEKRVAGEDSFNDELVERVENPTKSIAVHKVSAPSEIQLCLRIRSDVFVQEQRVAIDEEMDGKDDESQHYLLRYNNIPVGAARVRLIDEAAKIERVAILKKYRSQGFGKIIMEKILDDLKKACEVYEVKLGAQLEAIPFYEKLGFNAYGEDYMEANIRHKNMTLTFV